MPRAAGSTTELTRSGAFAPPRRNLRLRTANYYLLLIAQPREIQNCAQSARAPVHVREQEEQHDVDLVHVRCGEARDGWDLPRALQPHLRAKALQEIVPPTTLTTTAAAAAAIARVRASVLRARVERAGISIDARWLPPPARPAPRVASAALRRRLAACTGARVVIRNYLAINDDNH